MHRDNQKRIWVTWEVQRRNRSMSKSLGAELNEIIYQHNRIFRYIFSLCHTLKIFITKSPDVIFVQNPSIVLALFSIFYHKLTKVRLVIDAHNAGLFPTPNQFSLLNKIAAFIIKHTPITIVTNSALAEYVKSKGGVPAIMPDPLPEFNPTQITRNDSKFFQVLFICSWAEDEPYDEVINAAKKSPTANICSAIVYL